MGGDGGTVATEHTHPLFGYDPKTVYFTSVSRLRIGSFHPDAPVVNLDQELEKYKNFARTEVSPLMVVNKRGLAKSRPSDPGKEARLMRLMDEMSRKVPKEPWYCRIYRVLVGRSSWGGRL